MEILIILFLAAILTVTAEMRAKLRAPKSDTHFEIVAISELTAKERHQYKRDLKRASRKIAKYEHTPTHPTLQSPFDS